MPVPQNPNSEQQGALDGQDDVALLQKAARGGRCGVGGVRGLLAARDDAPGDSAALGEHREDVRQHGEGGEGEHAHAGAKAGAGCCWEHGCVFFFCVVVVE